MVVELAKTAGFCFGVKRAVDTVYSALAAGEKVFTFGPIVHNDSVCSELEKLGASIVSEEELDSLKDCTVIIRAHGIPERVDKKLKEYGETKNIKFTDATCPFVKKIHKIVEKESLAGKHIVIIGDPKHPEVQGIVGWIKETPFTVISDEDSLQRFLEETVPENEENSGISGENGYCIVAQTTFNHNKFQVFVEKIERKHYNTIVYDTICNATEERQREAAEIAGRNEAIIVIGAEHSSNTRKLYEICKQECANTYFCERPGDLNVTLMKHFNSVGITAGASTPKNIIKEVLSIMSEENFESLLEESLKSIHNGEVVEGTVIRVKEDEIALNIGYKADGIITRQEYTNDANADLRTLVKEGDTMQVKIIKVNDGDGQVMLSYKRLAAERGLRRIEAAKESGEILTAPVNEITSGGLSVEVEGVRIFIPRSYVSDIYEKDLSKYKDQMIEFKITEFDPRKHKIIGSRKELIAARKKEIQDELLSKISVGDIITGVVKNVTNFGVFIDMGGIDGLCHSTEIGWGRTENPNKRFKVGDEVRAYVKDINGDKIALSMKFEDENPWADADEKYARGTVVKGRVVRFAEFGAFVELEPGVDALLHISQISKEHIDKPQSVLKANQEIEAVVTDINLDEKKISLSMKALLPDEPEEAPAEEAAPEAEAAENASEE
ncbi:MAG: bifunctional 4-hydroxy-3-methylbut-2-enyl diphosphate reductase/30S ribosomal protein S1 [Lachnospiraceae bacterium]|nr:bifunctional 4-hydroxy-3-methylbut-2-enyl diphosphate reductase/30S ribosomal protein S1 [Lachnospiraceae bacterium]